MIAVLQRVKSCEVIANGLFSGKISEGLYILLGVEKNDSQNDAVVLAEKISKLRIFNDENGKMNISIKDIDGEAMVVSNFTLNANYSHGNRPEYFASAEPSVANELYEFFIQELGTRVKKVEHGVFGADMTTNMITDGPVTIVMHSDILTGGRK